MAGARWLEAGYSGRDAREVRTIAEYHGATVLHYNADFEHIAAVTGQSHAWIAARGPLD